MALPKATLRLKAPRNGAVDVDLKVPSQTDVYIRLSGGDVTLGPIEGNKDVETHAGDIDIKIFREASYGTVDAATRVGDVATPFWGTARLARTFAEIPRCRSISTSRAYFCWRCETPRAGGAVRQVPKLQKAATW